MKLFAFLETANAIIGIYWDTNPTNINCIQNIRIIYGIYFSVAHLDDQREENEILFDLDQLKQNVNEPYFPYYTRVMSNLTAFYNFLNTHETIVANKCIKK